MTEYELTRGQGLGAIKEQIIQRLISFGIEQNEAAAESNIMIDHITGKRPFEQFLARDEKLSEEQLVKLDTIIGARAKRMPIQYILQNAYFMGLKLDIRPGVFIPRSDTETLVEVTEKLLTQTFKTSDESISALEIGVGSGAVAVSLLTRNKSLNVTATDISEDALAITKENAHLHGVFDRLSLIREAQWWTIDKRFHAIISNPPYIPNHQAEGMQPEVVQYEPHAALFGPDEDGLGFYRDICRHARSILGNGNGVIAVEVGDEQAKSVKQLFEEARFTQVETHEDLNKIARVVSAICV